MQFTRANLDHAIKIEPDYADAWVLYGYAATHDKQPYLGLLMLDRAEMLGDYEVRIGFLRDVSALSEAADRIREFAVMRSAN